MGEAALADNHSEDLAPPPLFSLALTMERFQLFLSLAFAVAEVRLV